MISERIAYLDRRISSLSAAVTQAYNAGTDTMTWTLPYSVPVDGSEGILVAVLPDEEYQLTATRPADTQIATSGQGDLTGREVFFGVLYGVRYIPTRVYRRDRNGVPDETNRLTIRRVKLLFTRTKSIGVDVFRSGGKWNHKEQTFDGTGGGQLDVSVHAVSNRFRLEITSTDVGPFTLTGLIWEGDIDPRAQPA